jgi:hypothetical protein
VWSSMLFVMLLPWRRPCGPGFCRLSFQREGSLLAFVWPQSRGGIRGGVASGHRMAVPAAGRCLCGCWPRGGVPAPGLPVVRRTAGLLVGLPTACPGGGPLPEDLRAPAALRALPGDACLLPTFVLAWRLDLAETVGAVIGQVAGGRGRGPIGGSACWCPVYDRARVGAPVDLPRTFRTADLWLIHAASCRSRYSSWTCRGVRY